MNSSTLQEDRNQFIETYFRSNKATNESDSPLHHRDIKFIIKELGVQDTYDDWDFGRFTYGWYTDKYLFRVMTKADSIQEIDILPADGDLRHPETIEVLL